MEATKGLNPAQLHILEMLNYCKSEQTLSDLKKVLQQYFAKQAQQEADRLFDEGTLGKDSIETILSQHLRTPYNQK